MTERIALIDADLLAWRFALTSEETYEWGDGETTATDERGMCDAISAQIAEYQEKLRCDRVVVALSDPEANWRKGVLPSYKCKRDPTARPALWAAAREFMAAQYKSYMRPTLEGDDILGILATHPTLLPGRKVIVSIDKDMASVPGWLFNPMKDEKPRRITEADADKFHLTQTLTGDQVDNYPGCPGIGPKKAERILDDFTDVATAWPLVVAAYESRGLTEADALVQARVARIARHTDYDFKRKEIRLWQPPSSSV